MTLLAAFKVLLHRYTGQEDVVVGSPIAGRNRAELEGIIGFFVNTLVLRTDVSGDPAFSSLLARVRETTLDAYDKQDLPFELLVNAVAPERDRSRNPLFQIAFVLQNVPVPPIQIPGLTIEATESDTGTAKFDLTLVARELPQGLELSLEYSTDLFAAGTIERMMQHLERLLSGIVAAPERRISELSLLTDSERDLEFLGRVDDQVRSRGNRVDRAALPPPGAERPELERSFVAPRNNVEQALATIWAQVLGVSEVGVHDSFFELGGHSLLVMQLVSRVREDLGAELPLQTMFEAPTVAGVAEALLEDPRTRHMIEAVADLLTSTAGLSDEDLEAMVASTDSAERAQPC
jgi:non-ribosomal peptide synthetase component F